jgi:bacteriorhodopsin
MFLLLLVLVLSGETNLYSLQRAKLMDRLTYVSHINAIVCLTSFFFYLLHIVGALAHYDHHVLNNLTYLEYMTTCPWMMISFVVLGGSNVRDCHTLRAACLTLLTLLFGFTASLASSTLLKIVCFACGSAMFAGVVVIMNKCLHEHSNHQEGLFKGIPGKCSPYRKLAKKIFCTWIMFPLWWLAGADGMALLTNSSDANAMVKMVLNILAKGTYICFIRYLKDSCGGYDSLMDMIHEHNDSRDPEDGRSQTLPEMYPSKEEMPKSEEYIECRRVSKESAVSVDTCSTAASSTCHDQPVQFGRTNSIHSQVGNGLVDDSQPVQFSRANSRANSLPSPYEQRPLSTDAVTLMQAALQAQQQQQVNSDGAILAADTWRLMQTALQAQQQQVNPDGRPQMAEGTAWLRPPNGPGDIESGSALGFVTPR